MSWDADTHVLSLPVPPSDAGVYGFLGIGSCPAVERCVIVDAVLRGNQKSKTPEPFGSGAVDSLAVTRWASGHQEDAHQEDAHQQLTHQQDITSIPLMQTDQFAPGENYCERSTERHLSIR